MQQKNPAARIPAIDVHAHFGDYFREHLPPRVNAFLSGDLSRVRRHAERAGIGLTMVSPIEGLLPRGRADAAAANKQAEGLIGLSDHFRQWVILDPRSEKTFEQAERMLASPRCVGIKIHPEEHEYPIREYGEQIFSFASEHNAMVLTHSGEANSWPEDFVPFADAYPNVKLIFAHLGCGADNDPSHQVRAIQKGRQNNIFVDTSSAQSLLPGLIEWAVSEIGDGKLLFGTDSPLHFAPMMRARIDMAEITDAQKMNILYQNARTLFHLP